MLWLDKLLHPTVVVIRHGRGAMAKGRLPAATLRELDEVFADFGIRHGRIAVDGTRRCHFSAAIPPGAHQRLRNLLASA